MTDLVQVVIEKSCVGRKHLPRGRTKPFDDVTFQVPTRTVTGLTKGPFLVGISRCDPGEDADMESMEILKGLAAG